MNTFMNAADCEAKCKNLNHGTLPYSAEPTPSGGNVACRLYHATRTAGGKLAECLAALGAPPCF